MCDQILFIYVCDYGRMSLFDICDGRMPLFLDMWLCLNIVLK